jgi:hypothetical protein
MVPARASSKWISTRKLPYPESYLALFVRNAQLRPAVRIGHVKALEKTSCKYPIRRLEVKVDMVPRGNTNYVQDNMCLGQLPKRLVIGCVDSDTLNGTITKIFYRFRSRCHILHTGRRWWSLSELRRIESPHVNCSIRNTTIQPDVHRTNPHMSISWASIAFIGLTIPFEYKKKDLLCANFIPIVTSFIDVQDIAWQTLPDS